MKFVSIIFILSLISHAIAFDIVKINKTHSQKDLRYKYPLELLTLALENTKEKYGEYKIEISPVLLKRDRALKELKVGKLINVYSAPTRKEWEEAITPIYFPIRKGILGYKQFLINKMDEVKFKEIQSIDELKTLRAGSGTQWSITKTMRVMNFNIVDGNSYEGLFEMLNKNRFDYFPRGINEIYSEFKLRNEKYPNMVIESSKIVYIPQPTYFFVSKSEKRLKQRIKEGLWKSFKNGSFEKLFQKYHASYLKKANIELKTVFYLNNPLLNENKIFKIKKLWIR